MISPQASREPHGEADHPSLGTCEAQSEDRSGLSPPGGLPAVLDLHQCPGGRLVPSHVVHPDHALPP